MTPGNVSVQPSTPAGAGATTAPGSAQAGPTDFMLMLSQMAASGAPPAAVAEAVAALSSPPKDPIAELPDPEDIVGLFSLSLPVTPADLRDIAAAAQSFGIAGVDGADARRGAALSAQMQSLIELTGTQQPVEDVSGGAFESLHVQGSGEKQPIGQSLAASAAVTRPVHTPVGSAAWADEIGSRVMMMAEQGRQTASLRLSPEHLGPLEINITIQDDRASVWFGAAHADTRSAIETALPRLRELFESQGLALTDAGVFKDSPRERAAAQASDAVMQADATDEQVENADAAISRLGLVDAYA